MAIDPITLEVFRSRFDAIAEEMQDTLVKSAYSIILKEGGDGSCALFSSRGEVIAQATSNPTHLGSMIPAVEQVLARFALGEMAEGDAFILNDPYQGGTHVPDVIVVVPILWAAEVVALACVLAHQQDMGGKVPGSMATDATDVFQEGLVIPPCRLMTAGRRNATLIDIISRNVRVPEQVLGDINAEIAAGNTAARRVHGLIAQHGVSRLLGCMSALLDHAEKLTREGLAKIPDGEYEFTDHVDSDGVDLDRRSAIRVRVTIAGSDMLVDFTGSSPQVAGPANVPPGGVLAPVYYVVRAITGSEIPNNSGCFRPISVRTPAGSILNPARPAPVSIRYHTQKRVVDTLLGALAQAIPTRVPAASHGAVLCMSLGGVDPRSGAPFVYMECNAGGTGASFGADGVDNTDSDLGNTRNIPAEAAELEYPVRVWVNRLRMDSGGPGRHRGGLGTERVIELLAGRVVVSHRSDRHFTRPWGLMGGRPGASWSTVIRRRDGSEEIVPGRRIFSLEAGDMMMCLLGGGGGYGFPWERDPEAVLADVLDRKVSATAARDEYGVVIRDGSVDRAASDSCRGRLAREAFLLRDGVMFDRGVEGLDRPAFVVPEAQRRATAAAGAVPSAAGAILVRRPLEDRPG